MSSPVYPNPYESEYDPAGVPHAEAEYVPPVYGQPVPPMPGMIGVQYADMGARFLAYLFDVVVVAVVTVLVVTALALLCIPAFSSESSLGITFGVLLILLAVVFAIGFNIWYFAYNWAQTGQTPGQKMMRVRVVRKRDGQLLTIGMSLLRYIVGMWILDDIVFGLPIGYLWALWDPERQAWHDKIADSIVVTAL